MDHPYEETGLQWDRVPRNKRSKETPRLARLVCSLNLQNDIQQNAHTCTVNAVLKRGNQGLVECLLKTEAETHIIFNNELILVWFINAHNAQNYNYN